MAGVTIIHASDKATASARLSDAVAAAGFDVAAVQVDDPARLADAVDECASDARILIWSRPLVSHALHSGELPRIRQLPGLIEVSADGIAPPSRGDDSRIISISGWRGQPFHPGWQRIHSELRRLCGPRKPAPETPAPALSPDPRPQREAPAAPPRGARPKARLALAGGTAVLLVTAAVGAASWFGRGGPDASPRQELREAPPRSPIVEAPRPAPRTEPAPAKAEAPRPPAQVSAAAEAGPQPPRIDPASPPAPPRLAPRPRLRPSPPPEPSKKYSRKNSKVMRQFCERSGRSTPQCRTFLRSIRAGGAE